MKNIDLAISVVLFKTDCEEVQGIIETFITCGLSYRILLIDNSPTDEILSQLRLNNNVEYIHTGKNLGFGAGHNIGISKSKDIARFHLVLNADVMFDVKIVHEMISYMEKNQGIGLMAPKILNPDGSFQYSAKLLPTPLNLIVRRFSPWKRLADRLDYRYEIKFFDFDRIVEMPYFMGCFMLIDTEVFKVVPGFDERFFMYPEDIDLTRRIHKHFKTLYYPHVHIYHKHGKGSYKSNLLLYYHITSMVKYFNKWGWFFDSERKQINRKILEQFKH